MTFEAVTRGIQQTSPLVLQGRNMAMEEIARKQSLQRYDQQQFLQALMGMAGFMRQREKDEAAAGQQTIENERADKQLKMQQNESAAKVAQMAVQNKWTETQIGRVADSMGLEQDMLRAQIAAISGGEERAVEQLQMQQNESAARIAQMAVEGGWKKAQINEMEGMLGLRQGMLQAQIDALRGGEQRADEQNVRQGEAHEMNMDRLGVALGMDQAQLDDFLASEGYRRESEELGLGQMRSDLRVSEGTEGYRTDAAKYQTDRLRNEADIALFQVEQAQRENEFRKQLLELPPGSPEAIGLISQNNPRAAVDLYQMEAQLSAMQAQSPVSPAETKEVVLGQLRKAREDANLKFQEFREKAASGLSALNGEEKREYTALEGHIKALEAMAASLETAPIGDFSTGLSESIYFKYYQEALAPGGVLGDTSGGGSGGRPVRKPNESAAEYKLRLEASGY